MLQNSLYKLITARRSIRLFKQKKIPLSVINKVINCARLAPSAANLQFLEYLSIDQKSICEKIFPCLRFAAYVSPKRNPSIGKRPTLYIVLLINKERVLEPNLRDIGASAENILLSFLGFGLGGCWLQNIDKVELKRILAIDSKYEIDSIIAAGYPAEEPIFEEDSKNIKYWLDDRDKLHVPKRPLKDVLHYNKVESRG